MADHPPSAGSKVTAEPGCNAERNTARLPSTRAAIAVRNPAPKSNSSGKAAWTGVPTER